jgi:hypothetical protein
MLKEVVEVVRELQKRHEMKIYSHAYRFNNIVDLYKGGMNVYVIPENQHYKLQPNELLSFVESKLLFHKGYVKEYKKGKLGISYKEFATKKEELLPEKYQWKNNLDKTSEDFLYFLVHGESIKIGRTIDPISRSRQIATSLDGKFSLYVVPNKGFLEKTMHNCFAEHRKGGEWFSYSDRIVNFAKMIDAKFIHCSEFTRR